MEFNENSNSEIEDEYILYKRPIIKMIIVFIIISIAILLIYYLIIPNQNVQLPENVNFMNFLKENNVELINEGENISNEELSERINENILGTFTLDFGETNYNLETEYNQESNEIKLLAKSNNEILDIGRIDIENRERLNEQDIKMDSISELIYSKYTSINPNQYIGSISVDLDKGVVRLLDEKDGNIEYAKYILTKNNKTVNIEEVK